MNEIIDLVEKQLRKTPVPLERFQQITARLLGRGILVHGDNQKESELYNDALRVESILQDFFNVMGAGLHHDYQFKYFRLYPPGGDPDQQDGDEEVDGSMRENLSQHETACVLVLRFLYDQALQEGTLDDEARVQISLEALHTALQTHLKRSLPERASERKTIFRKLKRFKLIYFQNEDDLEKPESWLLIRPMIVGFVHGDALNVIPLNHEENSHATE